MTDQTPDSPQPDNPPDAVDPVMAQLQQVLSTVESLVRDVESLWTSVFGHNTRIPTPEPSTKE